MHDGEKIENLSLDLIGVNYVICLGAVFSLMQSGVSVNSIESETSRAFFTFPVLV